MLSSPAVADGKVFVGTIYCLDENTGSLIWSYERGSGRSSPAVANGKAFFGSGDNKIYCFGMKSPPTPTATPTAAPTAKPTAVPTVAPATPRPAPATAYPTPAPIAYPTPVPTSPNLQISATPSPVEAGKTVTIRVKSNGWGVEGANVYYAKSIYDIKTGRDVVINGAYIGTTSEGGWLSYTFDKSGVYAIGVTYNRLYNPSIEHLTVTAPTPKPTPPPIARPTPTPPPVLPISPEYFYIIPIALFLILLPIIFYIRGKRKKPATTPEKPSPPSPEQKEEQIISPTSKSITIERAIYDPCKRDFMERALPRMKDWINRYDPGAYWFAVSIQNNTDRAIEEWGIELAFSSALKVKDAKIEGIEIEIPQEAHLNSFKISVPKEYGIVIPKGGAQRVYFKLRAEKPKTTYEISGVFKSEFSGDVPIRIKEFKYLCDTGVSPEAVKVELKKTFSEKDAARLALSFKTIQELDRMCNQDIKTEEYLDKLSVLKNYTEGFSD
ncbi:MAG: PQQ-binding-like beta-propeller repeat protein, partial [Methanophagales archaeon]|nr:PQQ-binding-like beta-propeller repeat protein [Methanophagales archaeon]